MDLDSDRFTGGNHGPSTDDDDYDADADADDAEYKDSLVSSKKQSKLQLLKIDLPWLPPEDQTQKALPSLMNQTALVSPSQEESLLILVQNLLQYSPQHQDTAFWIQQLEGEEMKYSAKLAKYTQAGGFL